MKNIILSLLSIIVFYSCNNKDKIEIVQPTKIGLFLDSLKSLQPGFTNNEVTINKFNSTFKNTIFKKLKSENDFFEDIDFKMEGVNKFNKGYLINLSKFSSYYVNDSILYSGNFNAICITNDENLVSNLKNDSLYRFKAKFKGELNKFPYLQNSINGSLYTPFIGYHNYNYDLGVLIFELDTIYKSKNQLE